MATESYEFTGKSVEDAVAEGLKTLKLRAEEVSIDSSRTRASAPGGRR